MLLKADFDNSSNSLEEEKKKVEDLVDDVNQKDEKIIVLTNSMVGKSSEVELAKELEVLKKENEALRLELQCKDASEKKTEDEEQKEEQKEEYLLSPESRSDCPLNASICLLY